MPEKQLSVLAMSYLMILYVFFPIHLNFPITSRCVLKAFIHIKNSGLYYAYLRKFFLFQKDAIFVLLYMHVVFD